MSAQCYVSNELTHFVGREKLNDPEQQYALFLKILGDRPDRDPGKPRQG